MQLSSREKLVRYPAPAEAIKSEVPCECEITIMQISCREKVVRYQVKSSGLFQKPQWKNINERTFGMTPPPPPQDRGKGGFDRHTFYKTRDYNINRRRKKDGERKEKWGEKSCYRSTYSWHQNSVIINLKKCAKFTSIRFFLLQKRL